MDRVSWQVAWGVMPFCPVWTPGPGGRPLGPYIARGCPHPAMTYQVSATVLVLVGGPGRSHCESDRSLRTGTKRASRAWKPVLAPGFRSRYSGPLAPGPLVEGVHDLLFDSPAQRDLVTLGLGPLPDRPVLVGMRGPGQRGS